MAYRLRKFIDIGANLTDAMYSGVYNGNQKHEPDLERVLERSWKSGLDKIIITGGNLEESRKALELTKLDERLYCTVGCHPTRCSEFETNPNEYLERLNDLIENNPKKIRAIGECGLDYERLQFCPVDVQKKYFEVQLDGLKSHNLPLFLHCRKAADDLHDILKKFSNVKGVVHSFDGSLDEAKRFLDMGLHIGLNGCSLKSRQNLETVNELPTDKILIETDCPWCEIRPTHESYQYVDKDNVLKSVKKEKWNANELVKSRNEPCNIRQVLDVIAAVKQENADKLAEIFYENTMKLFFPEM